jgi:hypothetical protein
MNSNDIGHHILPINTNILARKSRRMVGLIREEKKD